MIKSMTDVKSTIDEGLGGIKLSSSSRREIWGKIRETGGSELTGANVVKREHHRRRPGRRTLAILVAVLLLIFAFSALCIAAELPWKFFNLFEPVNLTSVCDGVELKVVSAVADDDSVQILYTMRDLEGDRISDTTSIYDFNVSGATTIGNFPETYDVKTKTATFRLAGDNGREMKGRNLTLSVQSFLSGSDMELYKTNLYVEDLLQKREEDFGQPSFRSYHAQEEDSFWTAQNQSGADIQEQFAEADQAYLLAEETMDMGIPGLDWVAVTNIGYKDGWLHVRVRYDESKADINHGYLRLIDSSGDELDGAILNTPLPDNSEEYIIRVENIEDLRGVYLGGVYTNYESLYTGEWGVTFEVKGLKTMEFSCDVKGDSASVNKVVLSPLGAMIYGKGEPEESILLQMKDGTEIESEGYSCSGDGETGEFQCKYKFKEPLFIEEVRSITIYQERVDLTV